MADVIVVSELSPTFSSSKTDPILYARPSFQTEPICVMIVGIQLNSMINQNSTECLQQSAKCRTGGTTIQAESGKKIIDKMNYLFTRIPRNYTRRAITFVCDEGCTGGVSDTVRESKNRGSRLSDKKNSFSQVTKIRK